VLAGVKGAEAVVGGDSLVGPRVVFRRERLGVNRFSGGAEREGTEKDAGDQCVGIHALRWRGCDVGAFSSVQWAISLTTTSPVERFPLAESIDPARIFL
jgi:hypothetical protein